MVPSPECISGDFAGATWCRPWRSPRARDGQTQDGTSTPTAEKQGLRPHVQRWGGGRRVPGVTCPGTGCGRVMRCAEVTRGRRPVPLITVAPSQCQT